MPENADKYECKKCTFKCSKLSNFNIHLSTAKHMRLHNPTFIPDNKIYLCNCGKKYKHSSTFYTHRKICVDQENINPKCAPLENSIIDQPDKISIADVKDLIMLLVKSQQEATQRQHDYTGEIINGVMKALPTMGNTTNTNSNNTNNTLNFYLTHTCKDAESIHDFTERFVERSAEYFKSNFREIASDQTDFASGVYDIFWKCLEEKPQTEKFIQTTDAKNGILYVKEKKKDEHRQLCGDAEFVKHIDGFDKAGLNIGHAMTKVFLPMRMQFIETMKAECGLPPDENDYDDEDEYEDAANKYKERVMDMKYKMSRQTHSATTLFDRKSMRDEVLSKTKRIKSVVNSDN